MIAKEPDLILNRFPHKFEIMSYSGDSGGELDAGRGPSLSHERLRGEKRKSSGVVVRVGREKTREHRVREHGAKEEVKV